MSRTTRLSNRRLCRRLAVCALTLLTAATPVDAGDDSDVDSDHHPDRVGPGLYALDGFDPAFINDDLEPLRRMVGNARVVGLGEATHTSGGIYRMKHRLFRFLAEAREHADALFAYLDRVGFADEAVIAAIGRCDWVDLDPRGSEPPFLPFDEVYLVGNLTSVPHRQADVLVYLEVSPAMHPLRWNIPTCP